MAITSSWFTHMESLKIYHLLEKHPAVYVFTMTGYASCSAPLTNCQIPKTNRSIFHSIFVLKYLCKSTIADIPATAKFSLFHIIELTRGRTPNVEENPSQGRSNQEQQRPQATIAISNSPNHLRRISLLCNQKPSTPQT